MDIIDLAEYYLSDPNGEMQTLLTTFMNMVMRCEAEKQAGSFVMSERFSPSLTKIIDLGSFPWLSKNIGCDHLYIKIKILIIK